MTSKPGTIEELELWIAEHVDDGKVDGEYVVKPGKTEFRNAYLSGDLYDLLILRAAPLSFTKSDVVSYAFMMLLKKAALGNAIVVRRSTEGASSEYRGYVPTALYDMVIKLRNKLELNNNELIAAAAECFVSDPFVNSLWQQYSQDLSQKHNLSIKQVEQLVFDLARLRARERRLQLSKEAGTFVNDVKIAT